MRALISFLFLFTFLNSSAFGQEISVDASAEVQVPADRINFHITLNAEAGTPQKAYILHKDREKVLVQLLKDHKIEKKNINFDPISITKARTSQYNNTEKTSIITRQSITLTLDDFDIYEQIQITLIDNNFDEFRGNFTSSEQKEGETEALKKALTLAREKADVIARTTGLSVMGIKNISYSYNQRSPHPMMEMRASQSSGDLLEFEQTVTVSASVSITYETQNN